ncbi:MAG TPA: hypothetical protein VGA69_06955 [Nitriliruptorales bacterium]
MLLVIGTCLIGTLLFAGGALAQGPGTFTDVDGDGVPDPPLGFPGDLDVETGGQISAELKQSVERAEQLQESGEGGQVEGRCGGWVVSYDAEGNPIDGIFRDIDGGPIVDFTGGEAGLGLGMTSSNPLVIDSEGQVVYYGELENSAGEGPLNHTWAIKTGGISLDAGGDDNPDANNRNAGKANLGEQLPFPLTGTVKVTGSLTSENGADCEGTGFVKFIGPPGISTPVGIAGALFGGIGLIGLLLNARPAITWKA